MPVVTGQKTSVFGTEEAKTALTSLLFPGGVAPSTHTLQLSRQPSGWASMFWTNPTTHEDTTLQNVNFNTLEFGATNIIIVDISKGAITSENYPNELVPMVPEGSAATFKVVILNAEASADKKTLITPIAQHFFELRGISLTAENCFIASNADDMKALKVELGVTPAAASIAATAAPTPPAPEAISEVDFYKQTLREYLTTQIARLGALTPKGTSLQNQATSLDELTSLALIKVKVLAIRSIVSENRNPLSWLFGIHPTSLRALDALFNTDGSLLKALPSHVIKDMSSAGPTAAGGGAKEAAPPAAESIENKRPTSPVAL